MGSRFMLGIVASMLAIANCATIVSVDSEDDNRLLVGRVVASFDDYEDAVKSLPDDTLVGIGEKKLTIESSDLIRGSAKMDQIAEAGKVAASRGTRRIPVVNGQAVAGGGGLNLMLRRTLAQALSGMVEQNITAEDQNDTFIEGEVVGEGDLAKLTAEYPELVRSAHRLEGELLDRDVRIGSYVPDAVATLEKQKEMPEVKEGTIKAAEDVGILRTILRLPYEIFETARRRNNHWTNQRLEEGRDLWLHSVMNQPA